MAYLNENPQTKILLSGGQGEGESITEAAAMERFLTKHGIEGTRIIKEEKSTSTYENFKFTREILREIDGRESIKIMIITSDFHMFRAKFLAKQQGFISYGISAETPKFEALRYWTREYFAVIKSLAIDTSSN